MAGAGTGKTRTLVDRALHCLLHETPPVALSDILMVTFTEAAAAEMRQRIRTELESLAEQSGEGQAWCREQLAMFETAPIGTLHSFCLRLIRQHFYRLELDPEFVILSEEEAHLLEEDTLDDLLDQHYRGRHEWSGQVRELIESHGRSSDDPVRALVLRLHHYTQTLPDPEGWFRDQGEMLDAKEPARWHHWLLEGFRALCRDAEEAFRGVCASNPIAFNSLKVLEALHGGFTRAEAAAAATELLGLFENPPSRKKGEFVGPFEHLVKRFKFLVCLLRQQPDQPDPLLQDWEWMRGPASTLLRLARQYSQLFAQRKRDLGAVDFHDLEQLALRLLLDQDTLEPTDVAREWQAKLRHIFVDEYQDINAAQDRILQCLSRGGEHANRFLVGDVKQSIYRFRLADPYIFQGYLHNWGKSGTVIPLQENFRSDPGILECVNAVFGVLMRRELGGVEYDSQAALLPGEQGGLPPGEPCVELHWRLTTTRGGDAAAEDEALGEILDLEEVEKEARLICNRLRQIVDSGRVVRDPETKEPRPAQWRDFALLLRSPKGKAETYAKEFARQNIPMVITKGGFYDSPEVMDLLSLLQILDNPVQDIPLLAVLRSPLVAFSNEDLAEVRLGSKGRFWDALRAYGAARSTRSEASVATRVRQFLSNYERWRRLAREGSLCRCLQQVLAETHYEAWLAAQPRGEQRRANLQRLLNLARKFDAFQRQGLFRFLRFIEAQQDARAEPQGSINTTQNAVRVMSIHSSKGLEFPVVVLADLGKRFNDDDLKRGIILDERYGICPQIRPPSTSRAYSSLSHWLAKNRQAAEIRAEELRVLYVAMTRARDLLILSGTLGKKRREGMGQTSDRIPVGAIRRASCFSDWLAMWLGQASPLAAANDNTGIHGRLQWRIWDDEQLAAEQRPTLETPPDSPTPVQNANVLRLKQRILWDYPYAQATATPAKTTVTALRREFSREADDEAHLAFAAPEWPLAKNLTNVSPDQRPSAADVGTAYHKFLQLASLERLENEDALRQEAARQVREGLMTPEQIEQIDLAGLARFWGSEIGAALRANAARIRRELQFTVRFDLRELAIVGGRPPQPLVDGDFVVVQGVVDLVAFMPGGLWVLDFKTDRVALEAVGERVARYEAQVRAYAAALAKIYQKPVENAWLYFTTPRHLASVDLNTLSAAGSCA